MCDPASDMSLSKDVPRQVVVGLNTLLESHAKLSKHDSNQTASTCAGNKVENITRFYTVMRLFTMSLMSDFVIDVPHQISKDQKR